MNRFEVRAARTELKSISIGVYNVCYKHLCGLSVVLRVSPLEFITAHLVLLFLELFLKSISIGVYNIAFKF